MSKLTRNNIAYDLRFSPYRIVMYYDDKVITYVFSSELYKRKFNEKIAENRIKISESLSNRFDFTITNDTLCDLVLYKKIEKRGFLINVNDGDGAKWLNFIKLDGVKVMSND